MGEILVVLTNSTDYPSWLLPPGVPKGVWEYAHSDYIAAEYDETITDSDLLVFDQEIISRYCRRLGLVVDLGCGTGRALIPMLKRGCRGLGVDLSRPMLKQLRGKAEQAGLDPWLLQANIVQLNCLKDEIADYCLCLFSTLGMLLGRNNRRQVLHHVWRMLKPNGLFIIHVHNVWFQALTPGGRSWLIPHFIHTRLLGRGEFGDRFFDYHGIPNVFVHTFTRRELLSDLRRAGFREVKLIPLTIRRREPLQYPWFFGWLRANGWIAVCTKRTSRSSLRQTDGESNPIA